MIDIINKPGGLILTSDFPELSVSTTHESLLVKIVRLDEKSAITLYSEKLSAYNGEIILEDIGSIIESEMRNHALCMAEFQFTFQAVDLSETLTMDFKVVYCEASNILGTNLEKFLETNFLTTCKNRRISPDFTFVLSFIDTSDSRDIPMAYINVRNKLSGAVTQIATALSAVKNRDGSCSIDIFKVELQILAIDKGYDVIKEYEIISFSVECGQRYASFFIDNSLLMAETFFFMNYFNVRETVDIAGMTKYKFDVDRSLARMPGKSVFYDRKITKTHELNTAPMVLEEVEFLEQLAASPSAYRLERVKQTDGSYFYKVSEILITDVDVQYNDDDKTQTVKFTWRYANNRPAVYLDAPERIFTSQFNNVYS